MSVETWDGIYRWTREGVATFNLLEAVFWGTVAAAMFKSAILSRSGHFSMLVLAAALFCLFGVSDIVEMYTGAWWRPWWLFIWKGSCVAGLVGVYARYLLARRAADAGVPPQGSPADRVDM